MRTTPEYLSITSSMNLHAYFPKARETSGSAGTEAAVDRTQRPQAVFLGRLRRALARTRHPAFHQQRHALYELWSTKGSAAAVSSSFEGVPRRMSFVPSTASKTFLTRIAATRAGSRTHYLELSRRTSQPLRSRGW
ncbi:uncharacterized protein LOC142582352 [Dermacentor variabilis]|uniref:uncharacterized protein LOC142582352 n=1 Tax=Dermacentor variabilis TaxID=34621 RepID=UPI003F5BA926